RKEVLCKEDATNINSWTSKCVLKHLANCKSFKPYHSIKYVSISIEQYANESPFNLIAVKVKNHSGSQYTADYINNFIECIFGCKWTDLIFDSPNCQLCGSHFNLCAPCCDKNRHCWFVNYLCISCYTSIKQSKSFDYLC